MVEEQKLNFKDAYDILNSTGFKVSKGVIFITRELTDKEDRVIEYLRLNWDYHVMWIIKGGKAKEHCGEDKYK